MAEQAHSPASRQISTPVIPKPRLDWNFIIPSPPLTYEMPYA
jgi:hypothetical protein